MDLGGDYALTALAVGESYLVRFDPRFGGGAGVYAAEYYADDATVEAAQPVAMHSTEPVVGIGGALSPLP